MFAVTVACVAYPTSVTAQGFFDKLRDTADDVKDNVEETVDETIPGKSDPDQQPADDEANQSTDRKQSDEKQQPSAQPADEASGQAGSQRFPTAAEASELVGRGITLKALSPAVRVPFKDGRIHLGTLVSKPERAVLRRAVLDQHGKPDYKRESAMTRAVQNRKNEHRKKLRQLGMLLQFGQLPNVFEDLRQIYKRSGLDLSDEADKKQRVVFRAAQIVLSEQELNAYLTIPNAGHQPLKEVRPTVLMWKGENEFARVRNARTFMQTYAERLREAVPSLPLKLREFQLVKLREYSRADAAFPFGFEDSGEGPVSDRQVLGMNVLGTFKRPGLIPADVGEAESLLKAFDTVDTPDTPEVDEELDRLAYIVSEFTILPPSDHEAASGLPRLRLESVEVRNRLFSDKAVRELEFSQQPLSALEGGERVVELDGPLLMHSDTMLLLLLKRWPELEDEVNWARALRNRTFYERRNDCPYGLFYPPYNRDSTRQYTEVRVEAYRKWTFERVAALPESPTLRFADNGTDAAQKLRRRADNAHAFQPMNRFFGHPTHSSDVEDMDYQLKEKGFQRNDGVTRVWGPRYRLFRRRKPYFLARGKEADYLLSSSDKVANRIKTVLKNKYDPEEIRYERWIEFKIERMMTLGEEEPDGKILIELAPRAAAYTMAGETIVSHEFSTDFKPAIVEKAPEPEPEPEPEPTDPFAMESVPQKAYGPALRGVQMGMTVEQADKIIREKLDVGAVFEAEADPDHDVPWRKFRLYSNKNRREFIKIYFGAPTAPDRVLTVARRLIRPRNALPFEPVVNSLKAKYGEPSDIREYSSTSYALWNGLRDDHVGNDQYNFSDITALEDWAPDNKPGEGIFVRLIEGLGFNFVDGRMRPKLSSSYAREKPGVIAKLYEEDEPRGGDEEWDVLDLFVCDYRAAGAYWKAWQKQKAEQPPETIDLGL